MKVYFLLFLILLLNCMSVVYADNEKKPVAIHKDDPTSQLEQVKQTINQLNQDLEKDKDKRALIQNLLKKVEADIQNTQKNLNALKNKMNLQVFYLHELKEKNIDLQNKLELHKASLSEQIRNAYLVSQINYNYLVLSQENPARITRLLLYYYYVDKANIGIISHMNALLTKITQDQNTLLSEYKKLEGVLSTQKMMHTKLLSMIQKHHVELKNLNQEMQSKHAKLQSLLKNKRALEKLIRKLQAEALKAPVVLPVGIGSGPLANVRGKLLWPTQGKIAIHYGAFIEESSLQYSGVLIHAPLGQAVHALYAGKVIFAQWLQGLGLLIILDHGKGYLSLYGYNQSLNKKVGDWVKAGEKIASVGDSLNNQPGLYFEIRYNSQPINPERWCHF